MVEVSKMCTRVVKYWYNMNTFFYNTVITRDSGVHEYTNEISSVPIPF